MAIYGSCGSFARIPVRPLFILPERSLTKEEEPRKSGGGGRDEKAPFVCVDATK